MPRRFGVWRAEVAPASTAGQEPESKGGPLSCAPPSVVGAPASGDLFPPAAVVPPLPPIAAPPPPCDEPPEPACEDDPACDEDDPACADPPLSFVAPA